METELEFGYFTETKLGFGFTRYSFSRKQDRGMGRAAIRDISFYGCRNGVRILRFDYPVLLNGSAFRDTDMLFYRNGRVNISFIGTRNCGFAYR